jgi:hypothetical protein
MTSINHKWYMRQEIKAERKAVIEVGGTSFADILRFNKLELEYPSFEKKKEVKVRGQDIKKNDLWQKFLVSKGYIDADLISLVDDVERLAEEFDNFLDTSCSERYHNLDAAGKVWSRKVVCLAVRYHIMENKLDGYLQGREDAFYDERVAYLYTLIRQIRTAMDGAARAIQHIVKDEEKAKQYLNDFFSAHYEQFRTIPFPQRDDILRLLEPDEEPV